MIAGTVAELMNELGVAKSHSRPRVSNDNPYIESHFKTLKYRPNYPDRFNSIKAARSWCRSFFRWFLYAGDPPPDLATRRTSLRWHSSLPWCGPKGQTLAPSSGSVIRSSTPTSTSLAPPRAPCDQSGEVTAVVHGVKVSFVAYPFPWRHDPDRAGSLRVASAREILQMKAYALGRRGTARDYADIAAGLREAVTTLADLVVESEGRFVLNGEAQFSERLFLQQLAYTDDIPESEKQAVTSELVSGTFEDMTAEIGRHLRAYLEDLGNDR